MNRSIRSSAAFAVALAFTAAIPAAAHAATLTNAGGTLTYTSAGGTSSVSFTQLSLPDTAVRVSRVPAGMFGDADTEPITQAGCTLPDPSDPDTIDCEGVTQIVAVGGGGNDTLSVSGVAIAANLSGGAGEDSLGGGNAADVLNGGAGDDSFFGGEGADVISGGSGIDRASYQAEALPPATNGPAVSITLDGVANDGFAGESKNFGSDVEDVYATSFSGTGDPGTDGAVTLTGSPDGNTLSTSEGPDTISGGAGNDTLYAAGGNDTLDARDGFADRVQCGRDIDTAIVDTLDRVSDDCENISTADVGNAGEDKPPTVAWTAPASDAKFAGSKTTTLTANAADDKGVAKVDFLDDDRVVCTDTVAPYTCAYAARGGDLGRNTLTAVASDALGQSASVVRKVVVTRFSAKTLSLKTSAKKDKRAPYAFVVSGALSRSTTVSKALNCTGTVKVTVKAGSKTLKTKNVRLSKNCTYKTKISLSSRRGFASNGKLKVKAAFAGNDTVVAKNSSTRTVTTR